MPSYLDFNSTKKLRDLLIAKTIKRPNGPQTFTENNYTLKKVSDFSNIDLPNVDADRKERLLIPQKTNTFKPLEYLVKEEFNVLPRRANLSLYWNGSPYFTPQNHNLISIYNTESYETESELFKLSASYIKNDPQGPIQARIRQNLEAATIGRFRLIDALNGNTATAINIVTGREPLIESNNKITVAKTVAGKGIDFLQTVSGVEFPFSEIPGDYLTNPRNPINQRPEANTQFGSIIQDVTGALGSLIGIRRRPKLERKPSDLMIEYLGEGQKSILFDLLSYSRYAPNYTTTARSQNSSKLFNVVDQFAQGVKTLVGNEAPRGVAYIGDDRGEDVKYAMNDFNDRPVRSSYYLSLMFDPIQSQLFERTKNFSDGGDFTGKLTWISRNSKNRLGARNNEWGAQSTLVNDSLSNNFSFRTDSILGVTQELLDSLPSDGGAARSHVANVIDQTSRIFREGTKLLSRGSAIKYVDEYGGETGAEFCRVWTKDRAYLNYSDTMKRSGTIRKYDDSVLSTPWNLNIAPVSNGGRDFTSSTNIDYKNEKVKKYMFSLENLAWKTSNTPGFTYSDLPICERGPHGGRIMWFPPYDLKFSEQNSARWETNSFLGRPEPIYTYQHTERSGQVSFKVIVDHPSVLNLLVKEVFKNMSDEEADNYINAVFAGCQDIDFYDLINRYTFLEPSDAKLVKDYLDAGLDEAEVDDAASGEEGTTEEQPPLSTSQTKKFDSSFLFPNDQPLFGGNNIKSLNNYSELYNATISQQNYRDVDINQLEEILTDILNIDNANTISDRLRVAGKRDLTVDEKTQVINTQKSQLTDLFSKTQTDFTKYENDIATLKSEIEKGNVKNITISISSSTSQIADNDYNYNLSLRRTHSIIKDILKRVSSNSSYEDKWLNQTIPSSSNNRINSDITYNLKDLGYSDLDGNITFKTINYGENANFGDTACNEAKYRYEKVVGVKSISLNIISPISFGCRRTNVNFEYEFSENKNKTNLLDKDSLNTKSPSRVVEGETVNKPLTASKKQLIDPMKKIITRTLSECYYFQKLEESDPVVFTSLKEKLKYFHPGFHSTTPEGLNSRLTFLLQCVRPGDTIPVIGKTETEQNEARNTSFGPPPICVLRIGDFYNSKVVIRDINITFEDSTWDLNPEGIGVQPMIANVSLQLSFIGGHGLSEPVNRLQNALSSNFYANTEMYDERSINTAKNIDGKTRAEYTKAFLENLNKIKPILREEEKLEDGNTNINGKYVGEFNNNSIDYTNLINRLYQTTDNYFSTYEDTYDYIVGEFGETVGSMILHPTYRSIKDYDVYENTTNNNTIDIFGEYPLSYDLSKLSALFKQEMLKKFDNSNLCVLLEIDKIIKPTAQNKTNRLLKPVLLNLLTQKIDLINSSLSPNFLSNRNTILSVLDKLNFVVKNEIDAKTDGSSSIKAELSGFTSNMLYQEYEKVIETLQANTVKMYEDLNPTEINFYNPIISDQQFKELFLYLIGNSTNEITNVFASDTELYDENTTNKLIKKLNNLLTVEVKQKKFKFKKAKRKNDSTISYGVTESPLTDNAIIEELKTINSTNVRKPVNNKLNNFIVQ